MGQHVSSTLKGKHVKTGGLDGGACLTGHEGGYKKSSCAYRWQAHEESKSSRTGVYNKDPSTPNNDKVATSAYRAKSGKMYPPRYSYKISPPLQPGDWYLAGPARATMKDAAGKKIPQGKNFTKCLWPYWHNAHHLIPKGTLNSVIDDMTDPRARKMVRKLLLEAKYNVNHHINVMILPQDKEVARLLGLPRHLILKDGASCRATPEMFDHEDYNNNVLARLNNIMNKYKSAVANASKNNCQPPSANASKALLENLSKSCYLKVVAFGQTSAGVAISDMPPI